MPYYIRVLGSENPDIHIDELLEALSHDGLSAQFEFNPDEHPGSWTMLNVLNSQGEALAQIERNPVIDGDLGKEELNEFREIIPDYKPTSAVQWLTTYFETVTVIYAFQLLNKSFVGDNFDIISNIKTTIWGKTNGILQADNEGFSNKEGYHILWQFADDVTGEWSCAVTNSSGNWDKFIMNLGDPIQRKEFQNGNIPKNARRL